MRSRAAVVALATSAGGLLLAPSCGLPLGGLGAGAVDGSPDAAAGGDDADDGAAPGEGGGGDDAVLAADAPGAGDGAAAAVSITPVGAITQPTGLAQQTHLFYAAHAARWWLLWIESIQPNELQASSSPDFVTWTPATPLVLPASHDGQGGSFSAAYADLGGVDVVHVTLGLRFPNPNDLRHFHLRATLSGGAILYEPPKQVTQVSDPKLIPPDGPATYVTADGHVWDATGWASFMGTGNEVAWESTGVDRGTSWDGVLGGQQNIAAAQRTVNSRTFATVGGQLVALWELADQEPDPTNVAWSSPTGLGWTPQANVFASKPQSANDWDAVLVAPSDLRVVRRALDGSFDHVRYDGATWTTLPAPPVDPGLTESGVVLLSEGARVAAVTIASDAASSVRIAVWDGSAWGAWSTLEGSTASRRFLSAWSSPGHQAVVWTQASGPDLDIVGKQVAF